MEEDLKNLGWTLCPELDLTSPAIVAEVAQRRNAHNNAQAALFAADNNHVVIPWTDDMIQAVHNEAIGLHRQQHRDDLYLHSRSFSRSKTKSHEYHDTSKQNYGSISSR